MLSGFFQTYYHILINWFRVIAKSPFGGFRGPAIKEPRQE